MTPNRPPATLNRMNNAEPVMITDMSACAPSDAFATKRTHGKWKLLRYETPDFSGTCAAAGPLTDAPPLSLQLGAEGPHAVYIGLGWHYGADNLVRIRLSGDRAYAHRAHRAKQTQIQEIFLTCADLSGKSLELAQQSAGFPKACVLMYVKLVPLTEADFRAYRADVLNAAGRTLVATIDGSSFLYARRPTTKQEVLEEFEGLRDSDFGTIWYGGAEVGIGGEEPNELDDFPAQGYLHQKQSRTALAAAGVDINRTAVEAAHELGMTIHMSMRPGGFAHPVPFEDMNTAIFNEHPQWRCRDKDGTELLRMSFAVPEVQEYVRDNYRRALSSGADGINILFNRGCYLVLWEEPFRRPFTDRHGIDPRTLPDDDPRVLDLRAEIMTDFIRSLRAMLSELESERADGKPLELSVVVPGTPELTRRCGFDLETWAAEHLVNQIGLDWAAFDAHSEIDGRAHYDLAYFRRITENIDCRVYPLFVPIEWQAIGDADERFRHYHVGDLRRKAVDYYDRGADGLLFWDITGGVPDGTLWPVIRRMGRPEELRRQIDAGKPSPVVHEIKRWDNVSYGVRFNPWTGG